MSAATSRMLWVRQSAIDPTAGAGVAADRGLVILGRAAVAQYSV
jgi:hypothetical protein